MAEKNIDTLMHVIDCGIHLQRDNFYIFENKKLVKSIPLDLGRPVSSGDYMLIDMPEPPLLAHIIGRIIGIPQEEGEIILPHPESVLELRDKYCPPANGFNIAETGLAQMEKYGLTLGGTIFFYVIKEEYYFPSEEIKNMRFPKRIRTKEPIRKQE